jgi:outer membrane lipoprotein-sorting protein
MFRILSLFALTFALTLAPARASAINLPEAAAEEKFADQPNTDGKKFVDQLRKNVDNFSDYSFDSTVFMFKPTAQQVAGGNICFKKVNQVRLTVKAKGVKDGSLVVRSADGKIKACGGPSLRFLKMNLEENSRILQVPNGYNAIKSDLGHLLSALNDSLAAGNKARVTTQPVSVPRLKQNVYVLQVFKPDPAGDVLAEQIFVNRDNNIPIEWDIFRGNVRYSVAVFENFKGNIGLDDSIFQI